MPNIKSAKKKMRQDIKRKAKNTTYTNKIASIMKKAAKSTEKNKEKIISEAYSVIDKAAKKGIIHANKAGRMKRGVSRIAKA